MITLFVGPMSMNTMMVLKELSINNTIGVVASRRQIEHDGGYVNNWNTKQFSEFMREAKMLTLVRDHGGPGQGLDEDDGLDSFAKDTMYLDIIHIDPWKQSTTMETGLQKTGSLINFCYNLNPQILFEVGTEQSIFPMTAEDLSFLLSGLKSSLQDKIFKNIVYAVIQSGTSLSGNTNTGKYDKQKLMDMIYVCKKYGLQSKEHNGDYLPIELVKEKEKLGLDAINIAPEFGKIETECILEEIAGKKRYINEFFKLCLESDRWQKWVPADFDPKKNKIELIKICGHYVFSNPKFIVLKEKVDNGHLDIKIKKAVSKRIMEFL